MMIGASLDAEVSTNRTDMTTTNSVPFSFISSLLNSSKLKSPLG